MNDTNHLIESLPDPNAIRERLKRNQAERSILRQMLKLAVRAQEQQDENATACNGHCDGEPDALEHVVRIERGKHDTLGHILGSGNACLYLIRMRFGEDIQWRFRTVDDKAFEAYRKRQEYTQIWG